MSEQAIIKTVLHFYPEVQAIYLFGSYGTEDEHGDSDVDIALLFPADRARSVGALAMSDCQESLGKELKKEADLVNLRMVSTVFQHEIIQEGRVIYRQSEYVVDEYEMLVLSLYQKLNDERAGILEEIRQSGRIVG